VKKGDAVLQSRIISGLKTALPLATITVGAAHALAVAVYLLPPSPLKERFGGPVTSYVNTLFRQNWHLFSPNPGTTFSRGPVSRGRPNYVSA
jgi:hypothetical protein